ncbi:ATP synthase F0, A subunit [Enterococcus thailandicus]|nr:ATP synthase F0, A subunit [Enterococcus thailandicus]
MQYLIDSYNAYTVGGGLLDKGWQVVNWFFVDIPFFVLKLFASFFLFCEDALNSSDFFIDQQTSSYSMSVSILNNFGGKNIGGGTLLGLAVIVSSFYLLYMFFFSSRNFSKTLLQYLLVVAIFFAWFGQVSTTGQNGVPTNYNTSTFLIKSVNEFTKDVQKNFISGTNYGKDEGSTDANGVYQSPLFDATVKQTFNYVNSGSLDGKMKNDEKLNYSKLLEKPKLSDKERDKFLADREAYVESLEKENPYFEQNANKTMEKAFAVWVGIVNLGVLSFPVTYINVMLTIIQIIVNLLILVFPIIVLFSFFPKCQMVMFKFFKALIGILFLPIIFGVFLSVLFWVNKLIDQAFLGMVDKISDSLLMVLSGGIILLGTMLVMIIVKFIFLRKLWKNRYRILTYFSDGQIEEPVFENKVTEKVQETAELGANAGKVGLGVYTGNIPLALEGASNLLPQNDKALNLGREYFAYDNGTSELGQSLSSLFKRRTEDEGELPIETEDMENISEDGEESPDDNFMSEEDQDDNMLEADIETLGSEYENEDEMNEPELGMYDEASLPSELEIDADVLDVPELDQLEEANDEDYSIELEPSGKNEMEAIERENIEFSEPITDDVAENSMNVVVDNFDELQFERDERAYFDGESDQELIVGNTENSLNKIFFFFFLLNNFPFPQKKHFYFFFFSILI